MMTVVLNLQMKPDYLFREHWGAAPRFYLTTEEIGFALKISLMRTYVTNPEICKGRGGENPLWKCSSSTMLSGNRPSGKQKAGAVAITAPVLKGFGLKAASACSGLRDEAHPVIRSRHPLPPTTSSHSFPLPKRPPPPCPAQKDQKPWISLS